MMKIKNMKYCRQLFGVKPSHNLSLKISFLLEYLLTTLKGINSYVEQKML